MTRPMNVVVVQQGGVQSILNRRHGPRWSTRLRRAHDGRARIVKNRARIAQVNVDVVVVGNDFGNAFCRGG